jgi:DNA-binding NarL/FixJ family response regulator
MDDGHRGFEARSSNDSPLPEPLSISDDAATYRPDARARPGAIPSRPVEHCLPVNNTAMSVAIVDRHSFTRECIAKSLQECDEALVVSAFDSCDSCFEGARTYDLILYHAHGSETDRKSLGSDERGAPFDKLLHLAPVVVLSDVDCPEAVLDAFESGARGYIPTTDTTLGLTLEIVRLVRAGGTFVPPSSLALRRTSRRDLPQPAAPVPAESFTPRQMAVLRHVKLGKANKMIARELEMSESTVKIHLRNIMKKMKAANRTEVACRAHAFETTHPSMSAEQG